MRSACMINARERSRASVDEMAITVEHFIGRYRAGNRHPRIEGGFEVLETVYFHRLGSDEGV